MNMRLSASEILKKVCPIDIYSSRIGNIPSPSREHIVPQKFLHRSHTADLNNIFVCTSAVNTHRGVLSYGVLRGADAGVVLLDGRFGCPATEDDDVYAWDLCLKSKAAFMPPSHSRGAIARTCLYMSEAYPEYRRTIAENVMQTDLLHEWDSIYPIGEWETNRSSLIHSLGFPRNTIVLGKQRIFHHITHPQPTGRTGA